MEPKPRPRARSDDFTSYGAVASSRQDEILKGLLNAGAFGEPDAATIQRVVDHLQRKSQL
jgi:hypothetical protein